MVLPQFIGFNILLCMEIYVKKNKVKKRRKKEKEIGQIFTHPPIIVGVNLTYLRRWESKFAIIGDIATLHLDRTTLNRFCPTNNFRL